MLGQGNQGRLATLLTGQIRNSFCLTAETCQLKKPKAAWNGKLELVASKAETYCVTVSLHVKQQPC